MKLTKFNDLISVSGQICLADIDDLARRGVAVLVCNRPDGEALEQTAYSQVEERAKELGMQVHSIAFAAGKITQQHRQQFSKLIYSDKRLRAYCRTGSRSLNLCIEASKSFDKQLINHDSDVPSTKDPLGEAKYDVLIVGGGSAGLATASSLRKRNKLIRIAVIEPSEEHFYQPDWTLVDRGALTTNSAPRRTRDLLPNKVDWLKGKVVSFAPRGNYVQLSDGANVHYQHLVIAVGLQLNWNAIEGLPEALGKNGVTSNYRYDLAPYTWQLVKQLKKGRAIFTQPLAGAPQKAMYISASEWYSQNYSNKIDVAFFNASKVLFDVNDYVPALMSYIEKYRVKLNFNSTLVKVDVDSQTAWFKVGNEQALQAHSFDILHVCPPQVAPSLIRTSDLCDESGWLDVDPRSLQHTRHSNIWGVGDIINTTNAKTMSAARKQAPVVAQNVSDAFSGKSQQVAYDGYGSCMFTVEKGKVIFAEFGYGGKLLASLPKWLNDGTRATRLAWIIKTRLLPFVYWQGMLKGREWFAKPNRCRPQKSPIQYRSDNG